MKIYLRILFLALLVIGGFFFLKGKETPSVPQLPNGFLFRQRAFPSGIIKSDAYKKSQIWKKKNSNSKTKSALWEFVGPTNVGGRITAIEIPSEDADTYYIGAASGGVFKTINAGNTWIPIFDEQSMLSIGDIEISKTDNNLIYVGTGEINAGGGSLAYDGNGIFKSEDAGLTWENKGLEDVGSISKVLIDPNNTDIVFAGAMGPLFRKDVNRGVYRSFNAGNSWEKVLFVSDSTGIIDMAINPINPNFVYAASWERIRRPNFRSYGGETSRIYRSQDGGDNWQELTDGLPTIASEKGRISIDISNSNPNILYASYTDRTGYLKGVYKTTNGGDTWNSVNSSQLTNTSYHWWFGGIFVDPLNPQNIFHAGFHTAKSTNGGVSWSTNSAPHVDQHAIAFNTQNPNEVLLGNDGGLYKSTNNGASFSKINNLPITQFYRYAVDEQNENKRYGGAQDNNTVRTTTGASNNWNAIYGGDGFQPMVDPTNTNTIYAMFQRGNLARSLNNAATFTPILNGINSSDRNNWDTAICMNPNESSTLYYGTQRLYKTTNKGNDWSAISSDLTHGDPGGNLAFGTLTSIDVSPIDSDLIYVGTDDANVWVTVDGGNNWSKISDDLPTHWVTKVKASPTDINTVYVTFSGYRYGDDDGQIFVSTNQGDTWLNISENLPDIPVNDIELDTFGNLFIATDIGVLMSSNNGTNWNVVGENLPSVVVTDLYYHKTSNFLYAATYGRSSYRIDLNTNLSNTYFEEEEFFLFPNPAKDVATLVIDDLKRASFKIECFTVEGKQRSLHYTISNNNVTINLKNLFTGIYYLKINNKGKSIVKKLIVKR